MEKYRFVFFFLSQAVNSRLCLESRLPSETTGFPKLRKFAVEMFSSHIKGHTHMTSTLMGRGGIKYGLNFADSEVRNSADELCLSVPL